MKESDLNGNRVTLLHILMSFSNLGLSPKLLEILEKLQFTTPTPIQGKAIPVAVSGKDVIGIAQTGTGKTLAFTLPMLEQIAKTKRQGLVIVPTRELAIQVEEQLLAVGKPLGVRQALLIGGSSMGKQIGAIARNPHVIVGTPGRIIDHLMGGRLKLDRVGVLVLDEADRMLDMGFAPQIKQILQRVPTERQTMLFSATMPPEIVNIAQRHMKLPVRVEIARAGTVAERVDQELFFVQKHDKIRLLKKLLEEYTGTVLVFSRTKYGAKDICRSLRHMGHGAAELHSNLTLAQRRRSLTGFKDGSHRVLVATDIAARGIDVHNIELVVNYDLPENAEDYVHRVGRTGRAGNIGHAISFITPDQRGKVRMIERLVRQELRITPLPELPAHHETRAGHRSGRRQASTRSHAGNRSRGRRTGSVRHHAKRGRTSSSSRSARVYL